MDTLVFQSYRTDHVPNWLARCLASVEDWAKRRGFAYRFLGDEFFDPAPDWYRSRCGERSLPVTDLARLLWASRFLGEGWRRVVWVDADVLVFEPDPLMLDDGVPHAVCRELWLARDAGGRLKGTWKVNNCFCWFQRGSSLLPFYIDSCQAIVAAHPGPVTALAVGPRFLTALDRAAPLPQIATVAMFSPLLIRQLVQGGGETVSTYQSLWAGPLQAANLCRSLVRQKGGSENYEDPWRERAVEALLGGAWLKALAAN